MKIARYCYLKPLAAMLGSLPLVAWHFMCVSCGSGFPSTGDDVHMAGCEAKLLSREAAP